MEMFVQFCAIFVPNQRKRILDSSVIGLACTKPYYFDVADDSRVCYVEKDFLSEVICKKLHVEEQCLNYDF